MNARRNWIFGLLTAVMILALAFAAIPAKAADGTWKVTVVHGINGRSLGLSKDLPVNITVYKDGAPLAVINDFTFKEQITTDLPAGEYKIEVYSQELGTIVPSMTLGPVMIPEGADLLIRAKLSGDKTPVLVVNSAIPAKAADGTWKVTVVHGINGRSLGLSKDLPVNITVYKDDAPLAYINDFTFKERFTADLPAGEYKIEVYSQELGTIVPSMTLGPVMIPEGADLLIRAKLSGDKTPVLVVKAK